MLLLGRICIADAKCTETKTPAIAVAPAGHERRFFWISADAKTAYAGVIAAKAESVTLDPKAYVAVDLTLDGDASRGWPLDLDVTLVTAPNQEWKWTLTREEARRLQRLYGPRGTYYLTAKAEHHYTQHARVVAKEGPVKVLLRLVPLTLARGVIVDADDVKIAGATVARADGSICATSNEEGAFTCELSEREDSRTVVVTSDGYASREVEVEHKWLAEAVDLGRIRLTSGRQLTVTVVRPEPAPVRVTLFHDVERYEHSRLKTIALAKGEETARFEAGEGKYYVVVEGDGPLERLAVPVTVKDVDVDEEIRIEPFQLSGSVSFGDEPLKGGKIEVIAPSDAWRVALPITDGAFTATMWQKGAVNGWLQLLEQGTSEYFMSPELGANPSTWDIRIEKRLIAGRVFDAATRAPLPYTMMDVMTETENSSSSSSMLIGSDGVYEVLANRPGKYMLKVDSPHHVAYSVEFQVTKDDRSRKHDIALEAGVMQPIDVVTPEGVPLSYVGVFEGVRPDRVEQQQMRRVDERGRYEVRGLPGTSLLVYFVSAQGSLAIERVHLARTNTDPKPLQVVIPPPSCVLRVRSVAGDGKPFPARLLIRYNGEFIPPVVLRNVTLTMERDQTGETVLPRLPAGAYEIWALAGQEDEQQLIATVGSSRQPVRVGLSGGEQVVTVVAPVREAPEGFGSGE